MIARVPVCSRSRSLVLLGLALVLALPTTSGRASNTGLSAAESKSVPLPSSDPADFAVLDDFVLFSADDGVHGRELWVTKPSEPHGYGTKLLMDIVPGPQSGNPQHLIVPDGFAGALFSAWTPEAGRELWAAHGNGKGAFTVSLVKDIEPGPLSSDPVPLCAMSGYAVFFATTMNEGREPWVSDGTPGRTALLKDLMPGRGGSAPTGMLCCRAGNTLYFAASDSLDLGIRLWKTDGTPAGTVLVTDVDDNIKYMSALRDKIIFAQKDEAHGFELWISDGTEPGTPPASGAPPSPGASIESLSPTPDRVYFVAGESPYQKGLWTTDGTTGGTRVVGSVGRPNWSRSPFEPKWVLVPKFPFGNALGEKAPL